MKLPHHRELDVIRYQLSKSSTSIGANFEEAQSTTMKEFVQKLRIALREANESKYWLKIVKELNIGDSEKLNLLLNEVHEISLMLGKIKCLSGSLYARTPNTIQSTASIPVGIHIRGLVSLCSFFGSLFCPKNIA